MGPSTTISVAVDTTPLLGTRTGIGAVVAGLVETLSVYDDLRLVGFGLSGSRWKEVGRSLPAGMAAGRGPMPAGVLTRLWQRSALAPVEWWTGRVDVVHGTNYVVPPSRRAARLVTVYDLTAVLYPELCAPASLRYPGLIAKAVAEGAAVHTLSDTVAEQIVDHFDVSPERVHVIHGGLPAPAPPAGPASPPGPDGETTGRPYILGLGTVEPRKNLVALVTAFDSVAAAIPDVDLKLAGAAGWGTSALDDAIRSSSFSQRIHRLGWVADTGSLIRNASVFAFPSLYEGFGFPPLEAMAAGVPVVASTGGSLPEILGDAALLVGPRDTDGLAGALVEALTDPQSRQRLIAAGHDQAARYTWAEAGRQMAALYRELAGR